MGNGKGEGEEVQGLKWKEESKGITRRLLHLELNDQSSSLFAHQKEFVRQK